MDSKFEKVGATSNISPVDSIDDEKISSQPSKAGVTASTTAVPSEDDTLIKDNEAAAVKPDRDLAAAIWTIVCGVALPCIPVIAISAVLIWFILSNQVKEQFGWAEFHIQVNELHHHKNISETLWDWRHNAGPALYTRRNPSTITTIASWTSRVIPYLTSSIMSLIAFFAARRIIVKSQRGDGIDLPSPQQLTLLIGLLGGNSLEPLKDTLLHRYQHKRKLADPIPMAFTALFMITVLGLLIPLIDTWFGIATTPAIVTQLYNTTSVIGSFSRALDSTFCPNGPGSFAVAKNSTWIGCSLHVEDGYDAGVVAYLTGPSEAARVAEGYSAITTVSNYTDQQGLTYRYLADKRMDAKLDFKAHTFAVTTQCAPITSSCLDSLEESYWPGSTGGNGDEFRCTPGFAANFTFSGKTQTLDASPGNVNPDDLVGTDEVGSLGENGVRDQPSVGLAFSTNSDLTDRVGKRVLDPVPLTLLATHNHSSDPVPLAYTQAIQRNLSYQYLSPQNPLHFATWATGYPSFDSVGTNNSVLENDPEVWQAGGSSGASKWILKCSATVYNVTYTWVNGSVHTFEAEVSNAEMGGFISAPFGFHLDAAGSALTSIATLAALQNTSQDLANAFADGWSEKALALSSGAMKPEANVIEQVRNSTVAAARVPIAPLSILLGLKLLYVVAVVLLALGAYCFTHPAETEIVKTQLSAKGLAAAHFDTPDMLQSNVVRELGQRLQPATAAPTDEDPGNHGLQRAVPLSEMEDKRIGVVANAEGAWGFAVVANGVWNGIKPVATDLIGIGASQGDLGTAGQFVTAWKK